MCYLLLMQQHQSSYRNLPLLFIQSGDPQVST